MAFISESFVWQVTQLLAGAEKLAGISKKKKRAIIARAIIFC
jgi:hypothetical protein